MANPLFNMHNRTPQTQQRPNIFQSFQEFVNNFRGDPKQRVQELLNNGSMTQEQFNQYSALADQLTGRKSK